ncbi:MAG: substrate-binding domain-containing protein [Pseudomonadota bacterium]
MALAIALLGQLGTVHAAPLVMASTTSTEQSGLFSKLLPAFTQATGIEVKVVAVGTGQAIDMGRRGDADVLFVHDQSAEEKLVTEGFALARQSVMYNDFVLIGPAADPAGVRGRDILAALRKVRSGPHLFVSRGDRSGTHAAELRYWKEAGFESPTFEGLRACGCGMGPALNMAASTGAYVLADRGTWLAFKNRAGLAVLVEGDQKLFNQYGVLVVNPARHPHVNVADARRFAQWLVSPAGQEAIASYKIEGQALFFPNAAR